MSARRADGAPDGRPLPSEQRFAERAAAERRRRRRRAGGVVGVVALVVALAWLVLVSPVLALKAGEIHLEGTGDVVDAAQVRATVTREAGTPLLRLDTALLSARLESLPGVREASVERAWPNGLVVRVTPRVPVVAVPVQGGYQRLDIDGVQVGSTVEDPGELPVVTVPLTEHNERILASVLAVVQSLPQDLAEKVDTVSATSRDTVTFGLKDGRTVVWGGPEDGETKAAVTRVLLGTKASTIDVSAPLAPVTS